MAEANQIIFIEAFLASKKIKLTLFLQALFKALKTTITFWCFVFVTLFNLQGTRCVLQRFLMISLRFPFVKNFFQKFLNSFLSSLIRKGWSSITAALAGDLIRIPYSVRLVKNFFELFKLFCSRFSYCIRFPNGLLLGNRSLAQSACLYYQNQSRLSTVFYRFFPLFLRFSRTAPISRWFSRSTPLFSLCILPTLVHFYPCPQQNGHGQSRPKVRPQSQMLQSLHLPSG